MSRRQRYKDIMQQQSKSFGNENMYHPSISMQRQRKIKIQESKRWEIFQGISKMTQNSSQTRVNKE